MTQEKELLTESHQRVNSIIPYGKDNSISREKLIELTGFADRKIRNIIEDLRKNGEVICSSSNQKGYWHPTKRKEVVEFMTETYKRARNLFVMARSAKQYLNSHEDQLEGDM